MLKNANTVLSQQPFSVLLGATITEFSSGHVTLELPIQPQLLQQHGFVHGGVISYCADNAMAFAAGSTQSGQRVVTSEFKLNYTRPAVGEKIVARAQVIHAGKTQIICRCDIFAVQNDQEKLCAAGQGTIAVVKG